MVSLEVKEDAASCVRFMVEGCAVASMQGMQEERETAARVRVERLREEVAWLAEALEAAEIELERRAIAREELVEALAASAAESTASDRVDARLPPDSGRAGRAAISRQGSASVILSPLRLRYRANCHRPWAALGREVLAVRPDRAVLLSRESDTPSHLTSVERPRHTGPAHERQRGTVGRSRIAKSRAYNQACSPSVLVVGDRVLSPTTRTVGTHEPT
jgi:hypothetical protein